MKHFLLQMILWHAAGRAMHGFSYWQAGLIALVVIALMIWFSRRRRWW